MYVITVIGIGQSMKINLPKNNMKRCKHCKAPPEIQWDHTFNVYHSYDCPLFDGDHPDKILPWMVDEWNKQHTTIEKD